MAIRIPAPDSKKDFTGKIFQILPDGTLLNNRYKVYYLTSGGMGVIYKAHDKETGEECIIKEIISPDRKSFQIKSFMREKEMLAKFCHPGIVNLLDFFQEHEAFYLVLEFIDGITSDEYVTQKKSDISVILSIIINLCDVLTYLHNMSPPVIYRDLKPENIIIDKRGRVKLIDFGIARTYKEEQLKDTEAVGSPGFASPEQYGTKQTDGRSDIYSLGALMHYLLTGIDPRMKEKPFIFEPVRIYNNNIPDSLEAIVSKALELNPEDRFQTVGDLKKSLERIKEINVEEVSRDYDSKDEGQPPESPSYLKNTLIYITLDVLVFAVFLFFAVPWSLTFPDYIRGGSPEYGWLASCESNCKNISTALELYATDNSGKYPENLSLLKGKYLNKIPHCPYSKKEYSYIINNNTANYTIWCTVPDTHIRALTGTSGAYPQYSSAKGIIDGKE